MNVPVHPELKVPVLLDFDSTKPIGWLTIDRNFLPPTPEFVFALGYRALEVRGKADPETGLISPVQVEKYEVVCVGLISDTNYLGHLKQVGKA